MSGNRATTWLLVMLLCGGGARAQEQPPEAAKGTLRWVSGDEMAGTLLGVEEGWLTWQAEELAEPVRIWLPRTTGWDAGEAAMPCALAGAWSVSGRDGSFFGCESWVRENNSWTLESARAGTVRLRNDAVVELRRTEKAGPLLYAGPAGEAQFVNGNPAAAQGLRWESAEGGVLRTRSIDQTIALPLLLPEKLRLDFWLRTEGKYPQFRWKLRHGAQQLEVETWMEELVGRGQGATAALATLFEPTCMLTLCVDFPAGEAVAYDAAGKATGRWKVRGERVKGASGTSPGGLLGALAGALAQGFKQRAAAAPSPEQAEIPEGLMLVNLGADLTLERLLAREWDGQPPQPRPVGKAFIETVDGAIHAGEVESLREGRVRMRAGKGGAARELPLEAVAWIRTGVAAPEIKDDATDPVLVGQRVVAQYLDGSVFHGRLAGADATSLLVQTRLAEEAWRLNLEDVVDLRWVVPEPFAGPPTASVGHLDLWERKRGKTQATTRGIWEPGPGEVPRWRADGAAAAVPVLLNGEWALRRSATRAGLSGELPGLAHLNSGEVVPVELEDWTKDGAVIHSRLSNGAAPERVPVEMVRALELQGEGLQPMGFDDAGWMAVNGTAGKVRREGNGVAGKVTLEPGAEFGHGSFLQGSRLRFEIGGSKSYGALRIRMFCDGAQAQPPHQALLVMRSGSTVYCGAEQPERPGEIRGNTNRIPIDYKAPFVLTLEWTEAQLSVRVNDHQAMTMPLSKQSRSGTGILFAPTGLWGNAAQAQVLTGLELEPLPGARARPSLDAETRTWALQLPRRMAEDAPRHLLLARTGDVLRGTVEGVDSRRVMLRSGLETLTVPRDRVAMIVMPEMEKTAEEKAAKEEDAAPLVELKNPMWLTTADGGVFRLGVTSLGPEYVEGVSPVAGACRFPARHVVALSSAKPAAGGGRFADWVFERAPEPEISGAAGGANGKMTGQEAPEFELTLAGGGRFKLAEEKGRVVVLDFWASWCGPCVKAMPEVMAAVKELPRDRVRLVGVNQGQSEAEVKTFLMTRGWDLEVALDLDQKVGGQFGVQGIPHTVVVGPDGKVAWTSTGYSTSMAAELTEVVRKLLP